MIEGYQKVADKKELQEGGLLKVEADGEAIVLSMINGRIINGRIYAIDAVCSHEDGPLEHGTLDGYEVECPWHGSKFDVRTGEVTNLPADTPQSVYEVKVQDNNILVKKQGKSKASPQIELTLFEKDKVEGTDVIIQHCYYQFTYCFYYTSPIVFLEI